MPGVGSSRKTISGRPCTPRTTSSRRRWPPERRSTRVRDCSVRPTAAISSPVSRGVAWSQAKWSTVSRTLSAAPAPLDWPTTPTRSRHARPARAGSSPRTATSPPSRRRMPSRISTVVVFPAPLGPSSAKTSPRRTSRSRPSTTVRCPYRLTSPRTRTAGSSCGARAVGPGAGAVVCMTRHSRRPRGRGTTEALVPPPPDRWTAAPTVTSGNRQWTSVGTGRLRVVDLEFERCYRAVAGRDARFDGWFFTAVHTTGIYCRPSCPARTPLARNVSFFTTAAAAQAAGFRACRRCRPDAVPGSPEWDVRADVVARAMRLIADGEVERSGVPGLAARLGYSERQLHRLLVGELGVGPLALARARRAQTARLLIETTDLPMADVAFAAGFASIRQFNDTVREVFATAPSRLRGRHAEA